MNMRIREAQETDKSVWDDFVNAQDSMFHQYFGWKAVWQKDGIELIPLMIEDDQSQAVGIFVLMKEKHKLFTRLGAFGFKSVVFKKDLSASEKYAITRSLIKFIDENYSSGCSVFIINDQLPLDYQEEYNQALIDSGFRIRRDQSGLPCSHIVPLERPFEEKVWKNLWSQKLRQALNKVEKKGIKVSQDPEFKYLEEFITAVRINYKRHKNRPPSRDFLLTAFKEFRDNIRLFVALDQGQPVAMLACIYTPSTCYLWEIGTYKRETDDINKYCYKVAIENACQEGYRFADFLGAYTQGLSNLKKRYGTKQTPIMVYEKRYSRPRVLAQYIPAFLEHLLFRPKYLWDNRVFIWRKIFVW
jgi:hypothetical protein